MATFSQKMTTAQLNRIITEYAPHEIAPTSQYELHRFKTSHVTVIIYTSSKCVVQGDDFDVDEFVKNFTNLTSQNRTKSNTKKSPSNSSCAILNEAQDMIIGSDEVGNGSYFGDLVVVSSVLNKDDVELARALGVSDSKKLSDKKIAEIAPILMKRVNYYAFVCKPEKYNKVVGTKYNAVSIKVSMHNYAIAQVYRKMIKNGNEPRRIVVDGFTPQQAWDKYVQGEKVQTPNIRLIPKAELDFLPVAVSSVIARYLFIQGLEEMSQKYNLPIPSGANLQVEPIAVQLVKKYGVDVLHKTTKIHFKTTNRVLNKL